MNRGQPCCSKVGMRRGENKRPGRPEERSRKEAEGRGEIEEGKH